MEDAGLPRGRRRHPKHRKPADRPLKTEHSSMRSSRHLKVFALTAAMAITRVCVAADLSGDWVGQLTGPFDSQYTAQYSHVMLKATGPKVSGTWGNYAVAGTLAGAKVE